MAMTSATQPQSKAYQAMGRAKNVQSKAARFDMKIVGYVLAFSIVLAANAFWHFATTFTMPLKFILAFTISILLGWLHFILMYKLIDWTQKETYFKELLVTFVIWLVATGISIFITDLLILENYHFTAFLYGLSFLAFLFPFLLYKTFQQGAWIPLKEYSYWEFPRHPESPTTVWDENKVTKAVFVLNKSISDEKSIMVTVKIPLNAKFGEFMPAFVQYYNETVNPEYPISDLNAPDGKIKWNFMVRTTFGKKPIDPERTVMEIGLDKLVKKSRGETKYPNVFLTRIIL